jgi:hypothetical protein
MNWTALRGITRLVEDYDLNLELFPTLKQCDGLDRSLKLLNDVLSKEQQRCRQKA